MSDWKTTNWMTESGYWALQCDRKDKEISRLRAALEAAPIGVVWSIETPQHALLEMLLDLNQKLNKWVNGPRKRALKGDDDDR